MCLDGPLCGEWVECLPELLGHNRTLTLGNGESLVMRGGSIKLLFETGSLDHASPACLLNCVSAIIMRAYNDKFSWNSSLLTTA